MSGAGIAQWVEHLTEKPGLHNSDTGMSPPCGKALFSQSQLSGYTLLQCLYSPCVQSQASTSVCTLKIITITSNIII